MNDAIKHYAVAQLLDITLIDPDLENARRTSASKDDDNGLVASMREQGQIQPIVVRPVEGGRYVVIAGARRLAAAQALEWDSIKAEVQQDIDPVGAKAIQVAENAHRAEMHPLDTWKAMVRLQECGMPLQLAAQCLNVSERRARQLDRLGRIAEPLIDAMRKDGIPEERWLAKIAEAPADEQVRLFQKHTKRGFGYGTWHNIVQDLQRPTLSRKVAIFNVDKATDVAWQEDVFAEPGSADHFRTFDVKGFMTHQTAALRERVAKRKKKGDKVEFAAWNSAMQAPHFPADYQRSWDSAPRSMKLPDDDPRLLLLSIDGTGLVRECLVTKKVKKAPAKKADGVDEAVEASPDSARPMTNIGVQMLAAAKTRAIGARLKKSGMSMIPMKLLQLMCLAVCGENVNVNPSGETRYQRADFREVLKRMIREDGTVDPNVDPRPIAIELLSQMIVVQNPVTQLGSGQVATAIGHYIAAGELLEPLDSDEFLKTLSGTLLREAAEACGVTGAKTGKAIRERLTGKIDDRWRPADAEFEPTPLKFGWRAGDRHSPGIDDEEDEEGLDEEEEAS